MTARVVAVVVALVTTLIVGLVAAVPAPEPADAALPSGFTSTAVFTGLTLPTAMSFSPDGKVYVAEKSGIIKVFPNASSNNGVVFKDLRSRVFNFWDRGLARHRGRPPAGEWHGEGLRLCALREGCSAGSEPAPVERRLPEPARWLDRRVRRVRHAVAHPGQCQRHRGTEQILIDNEWCQQFTTHSVGALAFDSAGNLYVTGGDGASYENADWGQFGGSLSGTPTPTNPCGDPPGSVGVGNTSPTGRGGAMRSQSPRRPAARAAPAERSVAAHQP